MHFQRKEFFNFFQLSPSFFVEPLSARSLSLSHIHFLYRSISDAQHDDSFTIRAFQNVLARRWVNFRKKKMIIDAIETAHINLTFVDSTIFEYSVVLPPPLPPPSLYRSFENTSRPEVNASSIVIFHRSDHSSHIFIFFVPSRSRFLAFICHFISWTLIAISRFRFSHHVHYAQMHTVYVFFRRIRLSSRRWITFPFYFDLSSHRLGQTAKVCNISADIVFFLAKNERLRFIYARK